MDARHLRDLHGELASFGVRVAGLSAQDVDDQLAFAELYGRELELGPAEAGMAGRTDRAIILDVLRLAEVPDPRSQVARFGAAVARLAPVEGRRFEFVSRIPRERGLGSSAAVIAPGLVAGVLLVFIPAVGDFVTPELLGGVRTQMIGNTIADQFGSSQNWPLGSAMSILLTGLILVGVFVYLWRVGEEAL